MAQISHTTTAPSSERSFSIVNALPILFGALLGLGLLVLPQTDIPVNDVTAPTLLMLVFGVISVGLAVWTVINPRGRLIAAILHTILGLVAVFSLFGFVAALSTSAEALVAGQRVHVGLGFWMSLLGAFLLVIQIFFPRPALSGVYGAQGMRDTMSRLGIIGELLGFLWKRKLYWLIPMVLTLLIFAFIIVLGSNSAIAPFIYTLF